MGPGSGTKRITALEKGARRQLLAVKDGWYKIQIAADRAGWVSGRSSKIVTSGVGVMTCVYFLLGGFILLFIALGFLYAPGWIDKKFILIGGLIILLALWSVGFNIPQILAALIFMDLIIGVAAIIRGFQYRDNGLVIGGGLCSLMALSSGSGIEQAGMGSFIMAIVGGGLG